VGLNPIKSYPQPVSSNAVLPQNLIRQGQLAIFVGWAQSYKNE